MVLSNASWKQARPMLVCTTKQLRSITLALLTNLVIWVLVLLLIAMPQTLPIVLLAGHLGPVAVIKTLLEIVLLPLPPSCQVQ